MALIQHRLTGIFIGYGNGILIRHQRADEKTRDNPTDLYADEQVFG